jgi:hypothetical protein
MVGVTERSYGSETSRVKPEPISISPVSRAVGAATHEGYLFIEWDGTDFVQDVVATPLVYVKYTAVVAPSPGRNLSPSRPRGILR